MHALIFPQHRPMGWCKSPPSPSPKTLAMIFDRQLFDQINLDPVGVIVTAVGDNCDFFFEVFNPQASILEDSVTGSALWCFNSFNWRILDGIKLPLSYKNQTEVKCNRISDVRKGKHKSKTMND